MTPDGFVDVPMDVEDERVVVFVTERLVEVACPVMVVEASDTKPPDCASVFCNVSAEPNHQNGVPKLLSTPSMFVSTSPTCERFVVLASHKPPMNILRSPKWTIVPVAIFSR